MCPSSGEITVFMRHLVFVTLCGWLSGMHTRQSFLYIFPVTMCPSSGETTVCMWHLVLVILYRWLSGMHTRQSSTQSDKYQVLHTNSYFSWWWAHRCPKHVQKRNKHTYKNCAPSWLYLQDVSLIFTHDITCTPCLLLKTTDNTENSQLNAPPLICALIFANIWLYIFQDSQMKEVWHLDHLNIQKLLRHTLTYGGYVSEDNSD